MKIKLAILSFTLVVCFGAPVFAQTEALPRPEVKVKAGWYLPRSSHSLDSTHLEKPGWYRPSNLLASPGGSSRIGWYSPKGTVAGDSTLSANRPGWYIPLEVRSARASRSTPFTNLHSQDPETLARANYMQKPQALNGKALTAQLQGKSAGKKAAHKKFSASGSASGSSQLSSASKTTPAEETKKPR